MNDDGFDDDIESTDDNIYDSDEMPEIHGSIQVVKYMIESGIDINKKYDDFQWTLLHCAAGCDWLNIVEYLVDNGADINALDRTSCTPLYEAAHDGQMATVKYLLDHGADKEHHNIFGTTAAMMAEQRGFDEVAEYIRFYELVPTKGVQDLDN